MSESNLELDLPSDYRPSAGELDNLVYLVCKYTCGWQMRAADKAVCLMMAGDVIGNAGISKLVEVACEYCWDHIMGEPEKPDADALFAHMKTIMQEWYKSSTVEERSNTG